MTTVATVETSIYGTEGLWRKRLVTIDSKFRENYESTHPNRYTIRLPPFQNVKKIELTAIMIPSTQYVLNKRNNEFYFINPPAPLGNGNGASGSFYTVRLAPGTYAANEAANELTTKLNASLGVAFGASLNVTYLDSYQKFLFSRPGGQAFEFRMALDALVQPNTFSVEAATPSSGEVVPPVINNAHCARELGFDSRLPWRALDGSVIPYSLKAPANFKQAFHPDTPPNLSTPTEGDLYRVTAAGTVAAVGMEVSALDWLFYDGAAWVRYPSTEPVVAVYRSYPASINRIDGDALTHRGFVDPNALTPTGVVATEGSLYGLSADAPPGTPFSATEGFIAGQYVYYTGGAWTIPRPSGITSVDPYTYLGTWDADTNTPTLTSGVGTHGDLYVVSVSGNTTLGAELSFTRGEYVWFDGTEWVAVAAPVQHLESSHVVQLSGDNVTYMRCTSIVGNSNMMEIAGNGNQSAQFSSILASLYMSAPPRSIIYDSFESNPIYFQSSLASLQRLHIEFRTERGHLVDFNGAEHQFTLAVYEASRL
jgi:hypothetical protein